MTRTMLLAGMALLATVAGAQTIGPGLKTSVPFTFKAGGKTMPAGDYTVTTPIPGVLQVSASEGGSSVLLIGLATRGTRRVDGALVFNRYGDEYFLSKVLSSNDGLAIRPSRQEREHMASTNPVPLSVVAVRSR